MRPLVRRGKALVERLTREGCHIAELWGAADDSRLSVARARVEPGRTTELHALDGVDELYLVVAGRGEARIAGLAEGGGRAILEPGDLLAIPAGHGQRIRALGAEELVFYCLCTPPFEARCYRALEPPQPGGPGEPGAPGKSGGPWEDET